MVGLGITAFDFDRAAKTRFLSRRVRHAIGLAAVDRVAPGKRVTQLVGEGGACAHHIDPQRIPAQRWNLLGVQNRRLRRGGEKTEVAVPVTAESTHADFVGLLQHMNDLRVFGVRFDIG